MSDTYLELYSHLLSLLHEEELLRLCKRISMKGELTIEWLNLSEALYTEVLVREAAAKVVVPPLSSAYERRAE